MQIRHLNISLHIIIFLLASLLWAIFEPGFMNADSVAQFKQALSGNYDDWHPPIISIIVHYVLSIGGELGTVTFIQILLGFFGVFYLSKEVLKQNKSLTKNQITLTAFFILILLLLPISALTYYLAAFIKDSWLAIDFIWLGYFSLRLLDKIGKTKLDLFAFSMLITTMVLSTLLRHNSLVLFPVFFLIILRVLALSTERSKKGIKFYFLSSLVGLLPLLIYAFSNYFINETYKVKKTYPDSQLIAMESLGAIVEDSSLKMDLPYISSHLTSEYKSAYIPGNVAPIMPWGPIKAVNSSFSIYSDSLRSEYYSLYFTAPLTLLKVKWSGFKMMIFPTYRYWFHPQLDKTSLGLAQNTTFEGVRNGLINFSQAIYNNRVTSLLFGEHYIWLLINLVLVIYFLLKRNYKNTNLLLILLIPLAYYCSYLIAATGPQFRFMFPATLMVQIISISLLISKLLVSRNKSNQANSMISDI